MLQRTQTWEQMRPGLGFGFCPLTGSATFDRLLRLSELQFPHLENGCIFTYLKDYLENDKKDEDR